MLFPITLIYLYKRDLINQYLVTTVDTDGMVLSQQIIISYYAEYASMRFQLFMGNVSPGNSAM